MKVQQFLERDSKKAGQEWKAEGPDFAGSVSVSLVLRFTEYRLHRLREGTLTGKEFANGILPTEASSDSVIVF